MSSSASHSYQKSALARATTFSQCVKLFYDERLDKISNNKKITLRIDTAIKETEELFNKIFDEFKSESTISIYMKA